MEYICWFFWTRGQTQWGQWNCMAAPNRKRNITSWHGELGRNEKGDYSMLLSTILFRHWGGIRVTFLNRCQIRAELVVFPNYIRQEVCMAALGSLTAANGSGIIVRTMWRSSFTSLRKRLSACNFGATVISTYITGAQSDAVKTTTRLWWTFLFHLLPYSSFDKFFL